MTIFTKRAPRLPNADFDKWLEYFQRRVINPNLYRTFDIAGLVAASASATNLASFSAPGKLFRSESFPTVELEAKGYFAANANLKTMRLTNDYVGGSTVDTTSSGGLFVFQAKIIRSGSDYIRTHRVFIYNTSGSLSYFYDTSNLVTPSAALPEQITFSFQAEAAAGDIKMTDFSGRYIQPTDA